MDLKKILFKIILIFNVVFVYSISCTSLTTPNTYTIGKYTLIIKKVIDVKHQGDLIIVRYSEAHLVDDGKEIPVISCFRYENGDSEIVFSAYRYRDRERIDITHL